MDESRWWTVRLVLRSRDGMEVATLTVPAATGEAAIDAARRRLVMGDQYSVEVVNRKR